MVKLLYFAFQDWRWTSICKRLQTEADEVEERFEDAKTRRNKFPA